MGRRYLGQNIKKLYYNIWLLYMSKDGDYIEMNEEEKAAYRAGLMREDISPIQEGDDRLSPIYEYGDKILIKIRTK